MKLLTSSDPAHVLLDRDTLVLGNGGSTGDGPVTAWLRDHGLDPLAVSVDPGIELLTGGDVKVKILLRDRDGRLHFEDPAADEPVIAHRWEVVRPQYPFPVTSPEQALETYQRARAAQNLAAPPLFPTSPATDA